MNRSSPLGDWLKAVSLSALKGLSDLLSQRSYREGFFQKCNTSMRSPMDQNAVLTLSVSRNVEHL